MRPGNCIAAAYRKLQSLQFALNEQLNTNTQPLLSQAAKTEHPPWGNRSDRKRRPRPVCIPFSRTVEKRRFLTKQVRQDAAGFRTAAFFSERERVRKRNTHRPRAALSAGAAAVPRQGPWSAVRRLPLPCIIRPEIHFPVRCTCRRQKYRKGSPEETRHRPLYSNLRRSPCARS